MVPNDAEETPKNGLNSKVITTIKHSQFRLEWRLNELPDGRVLSICAYFDLIRNAERGQEVVLLYVRYRTRLSPLFALRCITNPSATHRAEPGSSGGPYDSVQTRSPFHLSGGSWLDSLRAVGSSFCCATSQSATTAPAQAFSERSDQSKCAFGTRRSAHAATSPDSGRAESSTSSKFTRRSGPPMADDERAS